MCTHCAGMRVLPAASTLDGLMDVLSVQRMGLVDFVTKGGWSSRAVGAATHSKTLQPTEKHSRPHSLRQQQQLHMCHSKPLLLTHTEHMAL